MLKMFYLLIIFVTCVYIIATTAAYSESTTRKYGKRLMKRISTIETACRGDIKDINFSSKGTLFTICIKNAEVPAGIKYPTIPVYTCKDVYINDELVCKLHKLAGLFGKTYVAEFSETRHEHEIVELIIAAQKEAKRIDKEYWAKWRESQDKSHSFYQKAEAKNEK